MADIDTFPNTYGINAQTELLDPLAEAAAAATSRNHGYHVHRIGFRDREDITSPAGISVLTLYPDMDELRDASAFGLRISAEEGGELTLAASHRHEGVPYEVETTDTAETIGIPRPLVGRLSARTASTVLRNGLFKGWSRTLVNKLTESSLHHPEAGEDPALQIIRQLPGGFDLAPDIIAMSSEADFATERLHIAGHSLVHFARWNDGAGYSVLKSAPTHTGTDAPGDLPELVDDSFPQLMAKVHEEDRTYSMVLHGDTTGSEIRRQGVWRTDDLQHDVTIEEGTALTERLTEVVRAGRLDVVLPHEIEISRTIAEMAVTNS